MRRFAFARFVRSFSSRPHKAKRSVFTHAQRNEAFIRIPYESGEKAPYDTPNRGNVPAKRPPPGRFCDGIRLLGNRCAIHRTLRDYRKAVARKAAKKNRPRRDGSKKLAADCRKLKARAKRATRRLRSKESRTPRLLSYARPRAEAGAPARATLRVRRRAGRGSPGRGCRGRTGE